ncbi:MAG: DUF1294 domain-containing protein [Oscillospiraceae bacterium]|nr:DUF1294 domain-containing protein [Oscillospiraceae bacterium]
MPTLYILIPAYLALISLLAIILTRHDKRAAGRGARRVSERALLITAALGGSVAMFVTMRRIRHKTKRAKFMVGIPLIIALQIAAVILLWWRI